MEAFAALSPEHVVPYFDALHAALAAGACTGLERPLSMRFALGDAGSWVLRGAPHAPGAAEREVGGEAAGVDCTISCSVAVLLDLATGRKRPMAALVRGQIRVSGDRSVLAKGWALIAVMRDVAASFRPPREAEAAAEAEEGGEAGGGGAGGALRLEVHGASVHADGGFRFAVYHIEVIEGRARWEVTRRWSQLRALARRMAKLTPQVGRVPHLARMLDITGSFEPRFLKTRSQQMAAYLSALLAAFPTSVVHSTGPVAIRSFLTNAEPPLNHTSSLVAVLPTSPSARTVSSEDSLGGSEACAASREQSPRGDAAASALRRDACEPLLDDWGGLETLESHHTDDDGIAPAPCDLFPLEGGVATPTRVASAPSQLSPSDFSAEVGTSIGSGKSWRRRMSSTEMADKITSAQRAWHRLREHQMGGMLPTAAHARHLREQLKVIPGSHAWGSGSEWRSGWLGVFRAGRGGGKGVARPVITGFTSYLAIRQAIPTAIADSTTAIAGSATVIAGSTARTVAAAAAVRAQEIRQRCGSIGFRSSAGTSDSSAALEPGLLVQRLSAAARTPPIRAEASGWALSVRVAMLQRLRSLEALSKRQGFSLAREVVARNLGSLLLLCAALLAREGSVMGAVCAALSGAQLAHALAEGKRLDAGVAVLGALVICGAVASLQRALMHAESGVLSDGCVEALRGMEHTSVLGGAPHTSAASPSVDGMDKSHLAAASACRQCAAHACAPPGVASRLWRCASATGGLVKRFLQSLRVGTVVATLGIAIASLHHSSRLVRLHALVFLAVMSYSALQAVLMMTSEKSGLVKRNAPRIVSAFHKLVASVACREMMQHGSIFVKLGQHLSNRPDLLPPVWIRALQMLEDRRPPAGHLLLHSILRSEFRREPRALFDELETHPFASTSMAHLYRACLATPVDLDGQMTESSGEQIVIKLQRARARLTMERDVASAKSVAHLVFRLVPTLSMLSVVISAWETEMYKQLDFTIEASNLEQARQNLLAASIEAIVPRPVEGLVTPSALALSYEEGFKVSDVEHLATYGVDCEALVARLVQVYAHQMFIDGFFQADPHPRNILVKVLDGQALPVLLDFGMTVRFSESERLGYAKLTFAVQQMDVHAISSALELLGISSSGEGRFPQQELRFWSMFLCGSSSRQEAHQWMHAYLTEQAKLGDVAKAKPQDSKSSLPDRTPSSLIFFTRVVTLLRGLCDLLDTHVPFIDLFGSHAKIAIARHTPAVLHARSLSPASTRIPVALPGASLHHKLCLLLHQLCEEGVVPAGVQVCVMRGRSTLAEGCAGFFGAVDPRALHCDTPMALLEISLLLPVLSIHSLVREGVVAYEDSLQLLWPECPSRIRRSTLADVLSHRLHIAVAEVLKQPAQSVGELSLQIAQLVSSYQEGPGAIPRGEAASGAPLCVISHGVLLAAIVEAVCKRPYPEEVRTRMLEPLGLAETVWVGGVPSYISENVASVSNTFAAQLQRVLALEGNSLSLAQLDAMVYGSSSTKVAEQCAHELPLHVGMVNSHGIHAGCMPAFSAFASARSLCKLLAAAAGGSLVPASVLRGEAGETGVETSVLFGPRKWYLGLQHYTCHGGREPFTLGLHSSGGSIAYLCPRSQVSVAILLNDCQLEYSATRRILALISQELKLGHLDCLDGGFS
ncbi:hypothetical protein AB1Y20_006069 [Prymnesium parvum]|uniref:PX domain-containing protein n=1 Tax=Prymnesium parvum TaxID=97485 RepID=A0AB34J336_PRYPA